MAINLARVRKNGETVLFELKEGVSVIGRSSQCQFGISIKSVSRKHCQVQIEGDKITVSDLGSRNGTLINKKAITKPCTVKAGDNLQIGPVSFVFQINGQPELNKAAGGKPDSKAAIAEVKKQGSGAGQSATKQPSPAAANKAVKQPVKKEEEFDDDLNFLSEDVEAKAEPTSNGKKSAGSSGLSKGKSATPLNKTEKQEAAKDHESDDDLSFLDDELAAQLEPSNKGKAAASKEKQAPSSKAAKAPEKTKDEEFDDDLSFLDEELATGLSSKNQSPEIKPSKKSDKEGPIENNDEFSDAMNFLDEDLDIDKDVDAMGSASSLH